MTKRLLLCLLCCLAVFCGGCARQPRKPSTLQLNGVEPSTLDPAKAYDTTSISLVRVLYRGLVDYGAGADVVPVMARSYSVSPDGKTYTFKLRQDARFHFDINGKSPGRRVVAEDFRYAIERVLDPKNASDGLTLFYAIEGAKEWSEKRGKDPKLNTHPAGLIVKGDDEFVIRLSEPDATFINILTLPFSYAVSREWEAKCSEQGINLTEQPNGSGPFMLDEWRHDDHIWLRKNPFYFDPALPRCERLEQQIGGADVLQQMRFELGDIDVYSMEETAAPDYLRMMRNPKWKPNIDHIPMMDVRYLCMNNELKPFNNKLVRQAVNYAINKERIAATQAGKVQVARGVLPPGMPGYNDKLRGYSYDPAKATQLLKESGYVDNPSSPIVFWYADMLWYPTAAQMIQEDLKKIGMTVTLKSTTYPDLKTKVGKRGAVQLSIMGWVQDYPDPSNFLNILLNGKNITDVSSPNRAFYSNPQVNKLLDEAGVDTDRARRLRTYQKVEQMVMDDAPWAPLVHSERYVAHQPWIDGYRLHPMWSARYEYVKVNK